MQMQTSVPLEEQKVIPETIEIQPNKEQPMCKPHIKYDIDQQQHNQIQARVLSAASTSVKENKACSKDFQEKVNCRQCSKSDKGLSKEQQTEHTGSYIDGTGDSIYDSYRVKPREEIIQPTSQTSYDIFDENMTLDHNYVELDRNKETEEVKSRNSIQQDEVKSVSSIYKVPCDVCGHLYKKRNLKQHKKIHADTKQFTCDICLKVFRTASCLYGHRLHHKTQKDQVCQYCGKQFNNGPNLRQHIKIHTRERTLLCPLCPKMFRSNYVLKDHISRHSGEKPYMCSICSRSFKKEQELKRHVITFHSESRDHVCNICQRRFKSKSNRVKHEKTHDRKRKS